MGVYTPEMLPILSGLARGYAVCDQWFSSAPTETFPNRAFVAMATSQGRLRDDKPPFTAPSIFSALSKKGATWAVYGYDQMPLTRASVADITHAPNSNFGAFTKDFQTAVKNGTLPNFSFLEPQWGRNGNSQHSNYDVSKGDSWVVNELSSAVRANTGLARQRARDLVRGLYDGDGTGPKVKGAVFISGIGPTELSAGQNLGAIRFSGGASILSGTITLR